MSHNQKKTDQTSESQEKSAAQPLSRLPKCIVCSRRESVIESYSTITESLLDRCQECFDIGAQPIVDVQQLVEDYGLGCFSEDEKSFTVFSKILRRYLTYPEFVKAYRTGFANFIRKEIKKTK